MAELHAASQIEEIRYDIEHCDPAHANLCRTRKLVDNFYLCMLNHATCENAYPFGASYLCRSLERSSFSLE